MDMDRKQHYEAGREAGQWFRLTIPRRAVSGSIGERLGSGTGSSLEFQDFREYRAGDDIRRLDWGAYARTDKLTVRLFRDEIQPRVDLFSDVSDSMCCPSPAKAESALYLAGLLAEAAARAATAVAWWSFGRGWTRIFPYSMMIPPCVLPEFGGVSDPEEGLAGVSGGFARNSIRIVISDFLWEKSPESILRRFHDRASQLILLALLTEEELNPSISGPATLIDAESADALEIVLGDKERSEYRARLNTHLQMWEDAAYSAGAKFKLIRVPSKGRPSLDPLVEEELLSFD